jgi:hypothetical protein
MNDEEGYISQMPCKTKCFLAIMQQVLRKNFIFVVTN